MIARLILIALVTSMVGLLAGAVLWPDNLPDDARHRPITSAMPLAVIGDSGSHSYQDQITFPPGGGLRDAALRERTFQWTEVLARMRGSEIDLGPWVRWGRNGIAAWLRDEMGLGGGRAPRKEDYLYNFANTGAACKNIMGDRLGQRYRQVPRLVALMDREPERWRRGAVVINVGANDWNRLLDLQASDPAAPELRATIDYCSGQIERAVDTILASHPDTRILVVGAASDADDPGTFDKYRSAAARDNIGKALKNFDDALRGIATRHPARVAYVDFGTWFRRLWGERGPGGEPAYRTVAIGPLQISNTAGDGPENAWLGDGHAGTAMNTLWAQHLVERLRELTGAQLTPISDEEVIEFLTH
ncbi:MULTISPECIES: SGNH/GDSL hydrolase family protein [unclassified Variovorax]|uniref:SGNH/GDSL hydrolase family protein n=1 Tax=unclassified Variovorax TaxID=663243 RepID=UPI001BD645D9|nr:MULTISPECIES: SGNH/GDSL hydrolase family protein [unclassified Variovorax]